MIFIGIDEFAVAERPDTIRSVLGSCVGIALFDTRGTWFALNHFLDPESGAAVSQKMLTAIWGKGCRDFQAIIAGGAKQVESVIDVGERNIGFARRFVERHGISLLREDVGGPTGRTVSVSLSERGPELVTEYHGERREAPPAETGDPVGASDALKSSREAYDLLLEISKKSAARRR